MLHSCATESLTATVCAVGVSRSAGSSHGVAGVCSVVSNGCWMAPDITIGRKCSELLCTTSMSGRDANARITCR